MPIRGLRALGAAAMCFALLVSFDPPGHTAQPDRMIAFINEGSSSGFDQTIGNGVKKRAEKIGGVKVQVFDGEFNAAKQFNIVEDLVSSRKFQAIIIASMDSVGIANSIKDAIGAGIKVVAVMTPIGPRIDTIDPQIPGLTATIAPFPTDGERVQAQAVVEYCAKKDPCNVVIIIGVKTATFDNLRYKAYLEVLKPHANIKILASLEGKYDSDKSLTAMQDVLQAHKDINVVLSNADQHVVGALIALKDAGIDPKKLYITGGGASQTAIKGLRDGTWSSSITFLPETMGQLSLQAAVDALDGKPVKQVVDANKLGVLPVLITKAVLDAHPEFIGEWVQ
jgi:ribose transport system substrate-binding protein